MQLSDLTKEDVDEAIARLYARLNEHVATIVLVLAWERYSIPKEARRIGAKAFPYWFAADIDLLFRYAHGKADASASHVEGVCQKVLDLLHDAPAGRVSEDWNELSGTPFGFAILAARARMKLRDDDGELTAKEVTALSGLSAQKIAAAKMTRKKRNKETVYQAVQVRALFDKKAIAV